MGVGLFLSLATESPLHRLPFAPHHSPSPSYVYEKGQVRVFEGHVLKALSRFSKSFYNLYTEMSGLIC